MRSSMKGGMGNSRSSLSGPPVWCYNGFFLSESSIAFINTSIRPSPQIGKKPKFKQQKPKAGKAQGKGRPPAKGKGGAKPGIPIRGGHKQTKKATAMTAFRKKSLGWMQAPKGSKGSVVSIAVRSVLLHMVLSILTGVISGYALPACICYGAECLTLGVGGLTSIFALVGALTGIGDSTVKRI